MTLLISVIVVLLLAVIGLLLYPWRADHSTDRDALNRAFYQDRLRELAGDNAPRDAAVRAQMETDLQHSLLDDIPDEPAAARAVNHSRWVLLPGIVALVAISVGVYCKTGASGKVLAWQAVADETPQLLARVMDPQAEPLGVEDLTHLGEGLRARLQKDPDNREGWSILGRIGMVLNNATLANQAFEKAYKLAPENPDVKLDYAEILSRAGDAQQQQQASHMLQGLLTHQPDNVRILSLVAFNAYQQQQYPQAISAWQTLLKVLPAGDERRQTVAQSIAKAQVESGADKTQVAVTITLSPAAQRALPPHGALFVAVSDGQSALPVAAKKIPLGHFPVTVMLNDSNAMMPERLLSSLHGGVISVHISGSETAARQAGDWYGQTTVNQFNPAIPATVMVAEQQQ